MKSIMLLSAFLSYLYAPLSLAMEPASQKVEILNIAFIALIQNPDIFADFVKQQRDSQLIEDHQERAQAQLKMLFEYPSNKAIDRIKEILFSSLNSTSDLLLFSHNNKSIKLGFSTVAVEDNRIHHMLYEPSGYDESFLVMDLLIANENTSNEQPLRDFFKTHFIIENYEFLQHIMGFSQELFLQSIKDLASYKKENSTESVNELIVNFCSANPDHYFTKIVDFFDVGTSDRQAINSKHINTFLENICSEKNSEEIIASFNDIIYEILELISNICINDYNSYIRLRGADYDHLIQTTLISHESTSRLKKLAHRFSYLKKKKKEKKDKKDKKKEGL